MNALAIVLKNNDQHPEIRVGSILRAKIVNAMVYISVKDKPPIITTLDDTNYTIIINPTNDFELILNSIVPSCIK